MGKRLEKIQSAAREQKAKLYIIVACIALLVCGCTAHQRKGRLTSDRHYAFTLCLQFAPRIGKCKSTRCIWFSTARLGGSRLISSGLSS
uniref:Uncharacterized protein n=1 Tax=Oryza punctata TaxID=4537 RepID=A0A0E0L260_ORYPU